MRNQRSDTKLTELAVDNILLVLPEDHFPPELNTLDSLLEGELSWVWRNSKTTGKEMPLLPTFDRIPAKRILIAKGVGGTERRDLRNLYATLARRARQLEGTSLAVNLPGLFPPEEEAQLAIEGVNQGAYQPDLYRQDRHMPLDQLIIWNPQSAMEGGIGRGDAIATAQRWARDMVNEPASVMTPSFLLDQAQQAAKEGNCDLEILTVEDARRLGMGAFVAVAQGSAQPAFMIRLHHPGKTDRSHLAMIGKGLTFDSGGLSLKPWESMVTMKSDMSGAATVLAAFRAIVRLRPELDFSIVTPLTENLPSGSSFKPGDVLHAMNDKTIEVRSTDAEGRLILADALCWAQEKGATHLVDVATLTGACIIALGYETTGLFANQESWAEQILQAGERAGERLWRMPMFPEYKELISSEIADMANSAGRGGAPAGAISAAFFLQEFVRTEVAWAHLDVAGPAFLLKENRAQAVGATGTMVRTLVELGLAF
jgi:leucyl aminopeptidase